MRTILKSVAFAASSFAFLCGFGELHTSVATAGKLEGKNLAIQFLVKPDAGMHLTKEGPWSLTLSNIQGLNLATKAGTYVSKDFDEKLPGFAITPELDPKVSEAKADYVIKAFVCSEDKKHCFPQQHKGTFAWKKPS